MRSAAIYMGSVVAANMAFAAFGVLSVGPLHFGAGAVAIGATFTARDAVQLQWGKWGCWGWMLIATIMSAAFSPGLALASGFAFLASETVDWAVFSFSPFGRTGRVVASNAVSAPIDSAVFMTMALGGFDAAIIAGQSAVKLAASLAALRLGLAGGQEGEK